MVMLIGVVGNVNASLIVNSDGTITDSVTQLMWLQDANLAATETFGVPEYNPDTGYGIHWGCLSWYTAQYWIAAMNAANYKGYNDWRLPTTVDGPNSVPIPTHF